MRKRLSEESFRQTYRLNGVQKGATIAECLDKYGRWEGGYRLGVLVRKTANWVYVKWDDEDELAMIDQGDARYKVDRGKWRITNPRVGSPLNPTGALSTRAIAMAQLGDAKGAADIESGEQLTGHHESGKIASSPQSGGTPPTEEMIDMPNGKSKAAAEREAAQKAAAQGSLQERETYTAKQVATRCGTDAKTMRKFFRSSHSTVEPVGQGGRYEFAATDLPKIKEEFKSWSDRSRKKKNDTLKLADTIERVQREKQPKKSSTEKAVKGMAGAIQQAVDEGVFEEEGDPWGGEPMDMDEPTEEDLKALEEIADLDLDELDAEEV